MRRHQFILLIAGGLLVLGPMGCEEEKPRRNRAEERAKAREQEKARERELLAKAEQAEREKERERKAAILREKRKKEFEEKEKERLKKEAEEAVKAAERARLKRQEILVGKVTSEEGDGKVVRDEKQPDKPVIGINLAGKKELKDDLLKLFKDCTKLQSLNLSDTGITDDDLKFLEPLTSLQTL